ETGRGGRHAKLTARRADNNGCACNDCHTNARNKGSRLSSHGTDADRIRLSGSTSRANVDVAAPRGEICAGTGGQGDIVIAGCVKERTSAVGRVGAAGCVDSERTKTDGRVVSAACVAFEGLITQGGVVASSVGKESTVTEGGIMATDFVAGERHPTTGSVI